MWWHRACYSRRQQGQAALKGEAGLSGVAGQWSHPRGTLSTVAMQEEQGFRCQGPENRPVIASYVHACLRPGSKGSESSSGTAGAVLGRGTDGTEPTQGHRASPSAWIQIPSKGERDSAAPAHISPVCWWSDPVSYTQLKKIEADLEYSWAPKDSRKVLQGILVYSGP